MELVEQTPAIKDLASRLDGCDQNNTALNIFNFVEKEITYMGLKNPDGSHRPYRSAQETLEQRAGNCFEKSSLVIALARSAGIKSDYVFVEYADKPISHMVVKMELPTGPIFVDATAPWGYARRLDTPGIKSVRVLSDGEACDLHTKCNRDLVINDLLNLKGRWGALSRFFLPLLLSASIYGAYLDYTKPAMFTTHACHAHQDGKGCLMIPEFE